MVHNRGAISPFVSCGFRIEGLWRVTVVIKGQTTDEHYMSLVP